MSSCGVTTGNLSFFAEADRDRLEYVVAEAVHRLAARVHAYCWMTNHIHVLVQISDAPLGQLILRIASQYARAVQMRLDTTGHLFERRYHAVLVDADVYLMTLVRYIHLNPVRAGQVADPAAYPWSSHRDEPQILGTDEFVARVKSFQYRPRGLTANLRPATRHQVLP